MQFFVKGFDKNVQERNKKIEHNEAACKTV